MASYRWHSNPLGEVHHTTVTPTEYRGYLIYERVKGKGWEVVKGGLMYACRCSLKGARMAIDSLVSAGRRPSRTGKPA